MVAFPFTKFQTDRKVRWLANELAIKAKELYDQGMSLVDIAGKLEVSAGTVRSWKSRNGWDTSKPATLRNNTVQRCKSKRSVAAADKRTVDIVLENSELNSEQQLFCVLYAKTLNATQSYKKAYGCAYETAMVNGARLLRKTKVKEEINRLKKERFENQLFDEHDIFQWYLDIATSSITDYADFEGGAVNLKDSSEVDGRAIKKIKMGQFGASIELYDAMTAMDWLSNHMGLGTGDQQGLAQSVMQAWKNRKEKEGISDAE